MAGSAAAPPLPALVPLTVPQGNDVTVNLAVVQADGVTPQPLGSFTLSMTVKASQYAPDASGTILRAGTGLTIVSAPGGTLTALMTAAMLAEPVQQWYRLDLVDGLGERTTAIDGPITVLPV